MNASNTLYIQGLPYAASYGSTGAVQVNNIAFENYVVTRLDAGNTYLTLTDVADSAGWSFVLVGDFTSTGYIYFTTVYFTS
jgi:hypothetical protein